MADATTINKKTRNYLDDLGYTEVDLGEPLFDGQHWHVFVAQNQEVFGTVILDSEGEIVIESSFPLKGLDKPFTLR